VPPEVKVQGVVRLRRPDFCSDRRFGPSGLPVGLGSAYAGPA